MIQIYCLTQNSIFPIYKRKCQKSEYIFLHEQQKSDLNMDIFLNFSLFNNLMQVNKIDFKHNILNSVRHDISLNFSRSEQAYTRVHIIRLPIVTRHYQCARDLNTPTAIRPVDLGYKYQTDELTHRKSISLLRTNDADVCILTGLGEHFTSSNACVKHCGSTLFVKE